MMNEIIKDNKYVELNYKVIDEKTGNILTQVEFPLGYIHGTDGVLATEVVAELAGKSVGDIIEVPIDCNEIYGPRDESLVFTDHIDNVPEAYREVGMAIMMENSKGEAKKFLVTRMDDSTLTIDGNNPLCGRNVIFKLEILVVRDPTEEEIAVGGKVEQVDPELENIMSHSKSIM